VTATSCYVCGRTKTSLVRANAEYSYVKCSACGFRRREPLPTAAEEEELYPEAYYSDRGLVVGLESQTRLMQELIEGRVAILTKMNGGPGRLLDVGAGTGLFIEAALRKGWQATGVETSNAAARIARKITRSQITEGRIEDLTFDSAFDAVTLWDVLEHVPDPRAFLVRIRQLLRTGGVVAVSLPSVSGLKARVQRDGWRYYRRDFGHVSHFSPKTLSMVLDQAGFTPRRIDTTGSFNLGRLAGLDPARLRDRGGVLLGLQGAADRAVGKLGLGESLVAYAVSRAT
jgi:SAM-dependent methyltransferase